MHYMQYALIYIIRAALLYFRNPFSEPFLLPCGDEIARLPGICMVSFLMRLMIQVTDSNNVHFLTV